MKKYFLVFVMFVGVQFIFGQVENRISNDFAFEFDNDTIKRKGKAIEEVVIFKKIQKGYFSYFKEEKERKFLVIDTNNIDFVNNQDDYDKVIDTIFKLT